MLERSRLKPEARQLLELAARDRAAASRAIGELSLEAQVALVCEAPLARRRELLDLVPVPEKVIPALPEAELCFTVKAIGLTDAVWVLEHATAEQVVACVDLDAWRGFAPDRESLDAWMEALSSAGEGARLQTLRSLDPEVIVLFLRNRIEAVLKPDDDEGWQPPPGAQTLDDQFYFTTRSERDDAASVLQMLRALFERDYWTYFRMLQALSWELPTETEEWALRWRSGRLQDLGFPVWEEAMRIYGHLRTEELVALPSEARALRVEEWRLAIWLPALPSSPDSPHLVLRSIALLAEEERRAAFYAFVALANKVAVADQLSLGDAETIPRALEKAATTASRGLAFVARERGVEPVEVLRRLPLEHLFRVGANLERRDAEA